MGGLTNHSWGSCRAAEADKGQPPEGQDGARAYSQTCPRCGADFTGDDRGLVADTVVEHAATAHHHALDREVVLAHLEDVRPGDRDVE